MHPPKGAVSKTAGIAAMVSGCPTDGDRINDSSFWKSVGKMLEIMDLDPFQRFFGSYCTPSCFHTCVNVRKHVY